MANRRDLHIGIDGDARGFDAACEDAEGKARGLDRELAKLERQQAAQEKVTTRTAAAVQKYATTQDKAALAARKMGLEVKRAAEQAERAQVRAAAAAEAAKKGLLDEEKAARIAARADDALERAAIKAAEAQLAQAAAAEKLANEERKAAAAGDKHKASVEGMRGGLLSAAVAAAALSVPIGAAGLAVIGFAAVAAPAIKKVITAQADLATNWDTLDHGQKVAASSVQSLIGEYKTLAKSYEPEALQVFNGAVSTSRQLLPELAKTVDATKGSVADFATSVENTLGRQVPRVFGIVRDQASPALGELGTTFDQTATLAVSLVQDLAPMGLQLLGVANGGLRLLNALEQLNPHLVEVGATLLAVRGPASALGNLWAGGASKLTLFGKAAGEAEKSTATLSKAVGSSPNLYIGAALAVGLLSYHWATAADTLDHRIAAIRSEAAATKNSAATHQIAIAALGEESVGWTTYNKAVAAGDAGLRKHASAFDQSASVRIRKAIDAESKAVHNITAGQDALAKQYGITTKQADQLASAAGVDLSKGITGSGAAATAAQAKIRQYLAAVRAASDTNTVVSLSLEKVGNAGLLLQDRLAALDSAFGALAGPELQAFDSTTKTAGAFRQMDDALKKSHGSLSLATAAGQDARSAFAGLLGTVQENSKAQYQYESVTLGVAKAKANLAARAKDMLPLLLAETHGNKDAANAALDWANSQGLGKTRAEALAGAVRLGKAAFLAAAEGAGQSRDEALKLWAAYQKLAAPLKLSVDDADFLSKLHTAQGLRIDPKTGRLLGNNADYFNKWLKAKGLKIDPKTGRFLGNNADYYNKWLAANHLHIDPKTGVIKGNTAAFWNSVHAIPSVVGNRQINVKYVPVNSANEPGHTRNANGAIYYANGGENHVAQIARGGDWRVWAEPETEGEAYIPLADSKRKRSTLILAEVARDFGLALVKPMADGGVLSAQAFADGGTTASLSDILSQWQSAVQPASSSDVTAAKKTRATQKDQLANANAALRRAERESTKTHRDRLKRAEDIAAAERRVRKERSDLADATKKLSDVEKRYQAGRQSPAAQLGSALALSIKNTGAFIANLSTLTDRGFGVLAQHLLAQGDATAEKTAADAVKMSGSKLSGLQKQVQQADQQQTTLAGLGGILTIKTAMKGGANTWDSLLTATGLAPNDLAATLKLMTGDLQKTAAGQALLAMMKAHGFARGGQIVGPPGVDNVPLWGTAGETVMTRQATAQNRQVLAAMNAGARVRIPTGAVRGGDGAAAGRPVVINVYARDTQSALATAKATSHELGWELKKGGG